MPYFPVKDRFVFLHSRNYSRLNKIALKDKSEDWIRFSYYERAEENKEAQKLRHITINEILKPQTMMNFTRNGFILN
jgi:hypothetical protein